jgi:cytoskeletal protein CcmA (bactofilin family)
MVHEPRSEESAVKSLRNYIPKSLKEAPMITYPETTVKDQMQTTIISSDTSLTGELNSEGHVEILGSLTGNVKAKGNVKICGKVVGDIAGNDIELFSCKVQGNITAVASVMINNDSVIVGNVIASDMVLDGKLKGDITLDKSIVFKENATLLGKVAAGTISIKEGAKLYGEIQIKDSNKTDALFQEI